jgi:hypothetical protein
VAAGDIEHVSRLAEAGEPSVQRAHQRLAVLDPGAPMRGAGREVAVVEIVGLDPAFDQGAHQFAEHRRLVVDATQQHGLAQHGNAGIDQARAGRARLRGQLARMVGVQHHVGRLARALSERTSAGVIASGLDHGNARVHADDLDVLDRAERVDDLREARGDSTSGSPPVRITSQISRWARI